MSELKLGSLFDGIGGWLIAAVRNGVKPVWRAEIDEFPRTVSEFHFPEVTSYGDVREMHGNEVEPVDIICAGSPCQNLSLAGNRQGLNGSESSLFFESIRIVNEMREATNGQYPRFFVWENVFGAFSSNQGNDFRTVLEQITAHKIPVPRSRKWAQAGLVRGSRCDVAWRGLDAQYFGVPQRRKRIFLVADFAAENRCAGEILFNEKSMSRDSEESGETGQTASQKTERRSFDAGGTTVLKIRQPKIIGRGGAGAQYQDDQAYALATHQDQTLFDGTAYTVCAEHSNGMQSKNPLAGCVYKADTTRTLDANGGNPNCAQGGMLICNEAYSIGNGQVNRKRSQYGGGFYFEYNR